MICPTFSFIFVFALVRSCFGNKVIEVDGSIQERPVLKKVNVSEDSVHYFKKFGKLGRNYFIGINEKDEAKSYLPYINCQKYNKNDCDKGRIDACMKTVKCVVTDPIRGSQQLACMANYYLRDASPNKTFSEGDIIEPSLMDCWQHEERQLAECKHQEKCVADVRKTGQANQPSLFCCCRTHNCNRQMVYAKEDIGLSTTTSSSIVDFPLSDGFNLLQLAIIFFTVLFIAIFVVFVLSMPKLRKKICKRSGTAKFFLPFYRNTNDRRDQRKELLATEYDGQITLPDGEKVHNEKITLHERVSVGRFGQVYKAFVSGPDCWAAVKIVPGRKISSWQNEMEMYSIQALRTNEHIAEFYGGFPSGTDFWLVFNFYDDNSLYDLLMLRTLSLAQSLNIIISMLEGIAFLHQEIEEGPNRKPVIIHRDIKSKNILVTAGMGVRIADLGHAMKCETRVLLLEKIQGYVGTIRYMCPEVLGNATGATNFYFQQMDVYSAALVIWEVISRTETEETKSDMEPYALPYDKELGHKNPSIYDMRNIVLTKRIRPTTRASLSRNKALEQIAATMSDMWPFDPDLRITCSCATGRMINIRREFSIS
ncbi:hypothetical protein niasHS_006903 [Heterodera schachtii]|uniref:receptor protein serine/threonine kinase n=1 Tax=Heterodera schachtii TaxID=97005 RepID=A0ABD2JFY6_HETSC